MWAVAAGKKAYSDRILPACVNPWGFSQVEEHISRLIEHIQLPE